MKKVKKIYQISLLAIFLFSFLLPLQSVMAQGDSAQGMADQGLQVSAGKAGLTAAPVEQIVGNIIGYMLSFIGLVLLVMIVYGGILWLTAGGKSDQLEKAKSVLANAVIGLAIVLLAYSFTFYVTSRFTAATQTTEQTP